MLNIRHRDFTTFTSFGLQPRPKLWQSRITNTIRLHRQHLLLTIFFSRKPCTYPFHNLGDDVGDDAPFGKEFTDRFLQWFQHVGFIDNVPDEQASSLLELYVSFALSTGTMTPVYVRALKKKTKARPSAYVLRENSLAANTSAADLNGQLRIFVQFMKWVSSHLHAFSLFAPEAVFDAWVTLALPLTLVGSSLFRTDMRFVHLYGSTSIKEGVPLTI